MHVAKIKVNASHILDDTVQMTMNMFNNGWAKQQHINALKMKILSLKNERSLGENLTKINLLFSDS